MSKRTGLTMSQIQNWFINARKRCLHPITKEVNQEIESIEPKTPEINTTQYLADLEQLVNSSRAQGSLSGFNSQKLGKDNLEKFCNIGEPKNTSVPTNYSMNFMPQFSAALDPKTQFNHMNLKEKDPTVAFEINPTSDRLGNLEMARRLQSMYYQQFPMMMYMNQLYHQQNPNPGMQVPLPRFSDAFGQKDQSYPGLNYTVSRMSNKNSGHSQSTNRE